MSQNLSSAAVVIGTLRVNTCRVPQKMFDHLAQPHVQTDPLGTCFTLKIKLEHAVDGAPSQIQGSRYRSPLSQNAKK